MHISISKQPGNMTYLTKFLLLKQSQKISSVILQRTNNYRCALVFLQHLFTDNVKTPMKDSEQVLKDSKN